MASVGAEVTSHHWGFAQGFDAYFDEMSSRWDENRWRVERPAEAVVDDALSWLQAKPAADAPWFGWVHLFDAHHPYTPPEPFASRFAGRPYQGEVASADAQLSRLMAFLEESGELERTWIFLLADHGEGQGSHGESMHGVLLYDATTRIPMIVRPPQALDARRLSFPTSIVDVAPTVLALVDLPADPAMEGIDLSAWLQPVAAAEPPAERDLYVESLYAWHHFGWAPQRALVNAAHKLIDSTTPEVYARTDIEESQNLSERDLSLTQALLQAMDERAAALETQPVARAASQLSTEQIRQLEALGYLTVAAPQGLIPFRGTLPDPVTQLPVLAEVEQARAALQAGDSDGALTRLGALLTAHPSLHTLKPLMIQARLRTGDAEGALTLAKEMYADRPSSSSSASLGYLFLMRGDLDAAAEFFATTVATDPYRESGWRGHLHVRFLRGELELLKEEVQRALEYLPGSSFVIGMRGVVHAAQGAFGAAEMDLLSALKEDPLQPFLNHALGVVRRHQERLDEAEAHFLQEIQAQPPAIPSRRNLVELYATQRRYAEQLAQLEVIMAVEPPTAMSAHSMAQVLFNLQRFEESLVAVESCRELAPEYPACAMLEANILQKLDRKEAAQTAYDHALELKDQVEGKVLGTAGAEAGRVE